VSIKVRTTVNELHQLLANIDQVPNTQLVSKCLGLNWIKFNAGVIF